MKRWKDKITYLKRTRHVRDLGFVGAFLVAIFLPLPFAFRDMEKNETIIRWNAIVKYKWLGVSPSPEIIIGKQGWFYLDHEGAMENHRRLYPFTPDELSSVTSFYSQMHDRLAARNIRLLVVVAPDKQTIYPEYLPETLAPVKGETHLSQFMHAMRDTKVPILDLSPAILKAKAQYGQAYYRNDSHWNPEGAYAGYRATVDALGQWYPGMVITPRSLLHKDVSESGSGDLTRMMGFQKGDITEKVTKLSPPKLGVSTQQIPLAQRDKQYMREFITKSGRGEIKRVVVFSDSFAFLTNYLPLLSRHFQEAYWCWLPKLTNINEKVIEQYKPDLVIVERVERMIFQVPPLGLLEPDTRRRRLENHRS